MDADVESVFGGAERRPSATDDEWGAGVLALIWFSLVCTGIGQILLGLLVKQSVGGGRRLEQAGLLHALLLGAVVCNLLAAVAGDGGGYLRLGALLFFTSAELTLLLDWLQLADAALRKRVESDGLLSHFWPAQRLLNGLLYGCTAACLFLPTPALTAPTTPSSGTALLVCNAVSVALLTFCGGHALVRYGKVRQCKDQFSVSFQHFRRLTYLVGLAVAAVLLLDAASALAGPCPPLELAAAALLYAAVGFANWPRVAVPDEPKHITAALLERVLKLRGALAAHNALVKCSHTPLLEGCHFRVSRFRLQYADPDGAGAQKAPHAVVAKLLSWRLPLARRLLLNWRLLTNDDDAATADRHAMYLKSYQVESRFYRSYAQCARGFRVPRVYLNHDDSYRCKFALVMQEVAVFADGVASGFKLAECCFILKKLARFHATNWRRADLHAMNVWSEAGYWTGAKRRADKLDVVANWQQTVKIFAARLSCLSDADDSLLRLAHRLEPHVDHIIAQLRHETPKTLVHGDFKVGNVFISSKLPMSSPPSSPSSSSQSSSPSSTSSPAPPSQSPSSNLSTSSSQSSLSPSSSSSPALSPSSSSQPASSLTSHLSTSASSLPSASSASDAPPALSAAPPSPSQAGCAPVHAAASQADSHAKKSKPTPTKKSKSKTAVAAASTSTASAASTTNETGAPSKKKNTTTTNKKQKKKNPIVEVKGDDASDRANLEDASRLYVIDWQWFGCGLAACDVAHFVWTSVDIGVLNSSSGLLDLLRHYFAALQRAGVRDYSFKQFFRHFRLATIDYFLYMCSKWALSSPPEFDALAKQCKNGLSSRSYAHLEALALAADAYSRDLDTTPAIHIVS